MKIYLASGNAHKVQEFQAIADRARAEGGAGVEFVSAKAVGGMPEVVEDTGTFEGNARKKAQALRAKLEAAYPEREDALWVLADDSGICVDALGGGPGVESAYFAGPAGDPAANLRKLVEVMRAVPAADTEHPTSNVEHRTSHDGGAVGGVAGGAEGNAQRSTLNAERLSGGDLSRAGGPSALPAEDGMPTGTSALPEGMEMGTSAVPEGETESRRAAGAPSDGTEPTGTSALPGGMEMGTSALPGRGAHFVCVLVLLGPGGVEEVVEERVYGTLLVEPRGGAGFGYDPLFVPEGEKESLAELGEALKNRISHRARAAKRLLVKFPP